MELEQDENGHYFIDQESFEDFCEKNDVNASMNKESLENNGFEVIDDIKKYEGKEAVARRIITITDKESGTLREETEKEG